MHQPNMTQTFTNVTNSCKPKINTRQFEIMLEYMETHDDLGTNPLLDKAERVALWNELVDKLNAVGEPKCLEKWRKSWTDLKNNTKKKYEKSRTRNGCYTLSKVEKRVIRLLIATHNMNQNLAENEDVEKEKIDVKEDNIIQEELRCSTPDSIKESELHKGHENSNHALGKENEPGDMNPISMSEADKYNVTANQCEKRKIQVDSVGELNNKKIEIEDKILTMMDRFLEFEKERERMSHEREIKRMRQNEKLLDVVGSMVNVLENLAPGTKKRLECTLQEINES